MITEAVMNAAQDMAAGQGAAPEDAGRKNQLNDRQNHEPVPELSGCHFICLTCEIGEKVCLRNC